MATDIDAPATAATQSIFTIFINFPSTSPPWEVGADIYSITLTLDRGEAVVTAPKRG
jgi:hypothetical protein